ncbi:MAG TPA: ABC transporter ATP-binding protein [Acidimicrobiales bacterium]|nr:ABC transporter ATP-binding protein [Acidimicrobiales bacterium]
MPIALTGVTKVYRGGGGVRDLTLEVDWGEVFGFLGPNGAGKTTTIRLMLDLIRPQRGAVRLFGLDARRDAVAVHRRLGYLPGELALYERLSARETLAHVARLRGGPDEATVERWASELDLELDRPVRALSRGNRQKVGLVSAFMNEPDLLVLDEPTVGLDPLVQRTVHQRVREVAASGRTVFLSSHVLSEVAEVADRVGLIRDGRLVAIERVSDIRARALHVVDVRVGSTATLAALDALEGVTVRQRVDHGVRLEVVGGLNPLLAALAQLDVLDLSVHEPSLEDVFLSYYDGVSR